MFAVAFDEEVITVDPFFQLLNVYPVRVGVQSVPHASLYFFVTDEHPLPPLLL